MIVFTEGEPNGERNGDVQRWHAVRERINSSEPIFDFRVQRVSDSIHVLDVEASNSNVEEEIERNGKKIDPCNAQCDPICHPAIIEVGHIEDGSIGDEHESCNVEMRQEHIKPRRSERILEQDNQVALNGVDVRRHVKSCSSHQHSIDLVKPIFGIVDDQCNQQVQPITPNEINESTQRKLGPWWLEIRHQEDTYGQCRDEPSEIDAIHPDAS